MLSLRKIHISLKSNSFIAINCEYRSEQELFNDLSVTGVCCELALSDSGEGMTWILLLLLLLLAEVSTIGISGMSGYCCQSCYIQEYQLLERVKTTEENTALISQFLHSSFTE